MFVLYASKVQYIMYVLLYIRTRLVCRNAFIAIALCTIMRLQTCIHICMCVCGCVVTCMRIHVNLS